jgi:hypothetical protein
LPPYALACQPLWKYALTSTDADQPVWLPHAATCAVLRASVPESASKVRPPSHLCRGHLPPRGAGRYSSGADGFTGRRSTSADLRVANQASAGAGVEDVAADSLGEGLPRRRWRDLLGLVHQANGGIRRDIGGFLLAGEGTYDGQRHRVDQNLLQHNSPPNVASVRIGRGQAAAHRTLITKTTTATVSNA